MNNHESKCVLRHACKLAGSPKCTHQCSAWIAQHGLSGAGGRVGAANVPADYRLLTLANTPPITVKLGAKTLPMTEALRNYVSSFSRQFDRVESASDRIKSLYLYSANPGTGKTTTASALLNEWLNAHYVGSLKRERQPELRPAYFLDCNAFQTDYNQFNRAKVPESIAQPAADRYYRAMERAKQAPFAVLDDIGVRDMSEPFRADLHSVINHRVTNQLPTVYTSNIPMAELPLVFGEQRLYDRVRDLTMEIAFEGGSKRGMRR